MLNFALVKQISTVNVINWKFAVFIGSLQITSPKTEKTTEFQYLTCSKIWHGKYYD